MNTSASKRMTVVLILGSDPEVDARLLQRYAHVHLLTLILRQPALEGRGSIPRDAGGGGLLLGRRRRGRRGNRASLLAVLPIRICMSKDPGFRIRNRVLRIRIQHLK